MPYQEQLSVSYALRTSELLVKSYATVVGTDRGEEYEEYMLEGDCALSDPVWQ